MSSGARKLTDEQKQALLETLEQRFAKNSGRHKGMAWADVRKKLEANTDKLWTVSEMERTGGEPDVVELSSGLAFVDCSPESPAGRRSLCYDQAAREERKEHAPSGSAMEMADAIGVEVLSEEEYRELQNVGEFDRKTSSWLKTPKEVRARGGGIFGDLRYGRVFVYHNGVQSYYAARGFRGRITL